MMKNNFLAIVAIFSSHIVYARSPSDFSELPDFGNGNIFVYGISLAIFSYAVISVFSSSNKIIEKIIALFAGIVSAIGGLLLDHQTLVVTGLTLLAFVFIAFKQDSQKTPSVEPEKSTRPEVSNIKNDFIKDFSRGLDHETTSHESFSKAKFFDVSLKDKTESLSGRLFWLLISIILVNIVFVFMRDNQSIGIYAQISCLGLIFIIGSYALFNLYRVLQIFLKK